jgi:hypothetical protein
MEAGMKQVEHKKRRSRGPSPRGLFEEAKAEAIRVLEAQRLADREKTERLKAARLRRDRIQDETRP